MDYTVAITGIILLIITFVIISFWVQNRKISSLHTQKVTSLMYSIKIEHDQIVKRKETLKLYDFLKYNLSKALIPQKEIEL
jgi:hypothetical protein